MRAILVLASALGSWLGVWLGVLSGAVLVAGVSVAGEPEPCHRVRAGETLWSISRRYRVSLSRLRKINSIRLTEPLRVGARLALPSIRPGDARRRIPVLRARPGHLRRENAAASRDRLRRLRDLAMVRRFTRSGLLVPVPASAPTYYVTGVPGPLRVARPWTRRFIQQLAGAFHAGFGARLRITSLTRTPARQLAILRSNGGAAPAHGPFQSTHLTGASVDISTRSLAARELDWLRIVLGRLNAERAVHSIEEFLEPHFHVLVRRRYERYVGRFGSSALAGGC